MSLNVSRPIENRKGKKIKINKKKKYIARLTFFFFLSFRFLCLFLELSPFGCFAFVHIARTGPVAATADDSGEGEGGCRHIKTKKVGQGRCKALRTREFEFASAP